MYSSCQLSSCELLFIIYLQILTIVSGVVGVFCLFGYCECTHACRWCHDYEVQGFNTKMPFSTLSHIVLAIVFYCTLRRARRFQKVAIDSSRGQDEPKTSTKLLAREKDPEESLKVVDYSDSGSGEGYIMQNLASWEGEEDPPIVYGPRPTFSC